LGLFIDAVAEEEEDRRGGQRTQHGEQQAGDPPLNRNV